MRYNNDGEKFISDEDYEHLMNKLKTQEFTEEQIKKLINKTKELEKQSKEKTINENS